jgi:hypothetical protein
MVIPPSKTRGDYKWARPIGESLPLIDFTPPAVEKRAAFFTPTKDASDPAFTVQFSKVDVDWLDLSKKVRDAIVLGSEVKNRSDYLLIAANHLYKAGLDRDEVLSVLTDKRYWLSACAYEHAKTDDRNRAAFWLWQYTVKMIETQNDPKVVFQTPIEAPIEINGETLLNQNTEFQETLDWRNDIVRGGNSGQGAPKPTVENVVLILSHAVSDKLATRNFFSFRDTYGVDTPWGGKKGDLLTDEDIVEIKYWLGQNWRFEPQNITISEALVIIARKNGFDPVIDFLNGLPKWDGVRRLHTWLRDHFEAEGDLEYLSQVFTKWMVAFVMRAKMPGSKFDWFPIFEGPQGVGKSSFGRLLVGDEFFLDNLPPLADKDSALALQGIWAVELGELANMRKTEIEIVKAYITRTVDKARAPYGRRWQENPRRCVFFGTTNRSTYLTDETGNRRIKPIKVGRLDFKTLRAEREQLFAEALAIYHELLKGQRRIERYFELTGSAAEFEARAHQEKMVEDDSDTIKELLEKFVERVQKGDEKFEFSKFYLSDLFTGVGPLRNLPLNNRNMQFAAKALKKLGGESWKTNGRKAWKMNVEGCFKEVPLLDDFY